MKIITRDWIHPDAMFFPTQRTFNKKDLGKVIDYWKRKLVTDYDAKPGQKIAMPIPPSDITYFALFFAALELGLKLVVLPKPINNRELNDTRFSGYNPLDMMVYDKHHQLAKGVKEFLIENTTHFIRYDALGYFNVNKDADLDNWSDKVYAEPSEPFLLCTTSGTTGQAKLVNHTHEYLYDLCSTNYQALGFESEDKVLHLNSFNHGSSPTIYFLPSLKACKYHYTYPLYDLNVDEFKRNQWDRMINLAKKEGITKMLSPTNIITDNILITLRENDIHMPNLTIMVLGFLNPTWLSYVKEGRVKEIVSVFGCTEVGGPIFLSRIKQDDLYVSPRNVGFPIKNIFKTEIIDGHLTITLPSGKIVETGDHMTEANDGYTFLRKNKLKRINDIEINPLDVLDAVDRYIDDFPYSSTSVVVDEVHQKLYILTEDPKLPPLTEEAKAAVRELYSGMVELEMILYTDLNQLRKSVVTIKPDHQRLLEYVQDVIHERKQYS